MKKASAAVHSHSRAGAGARLSPRKRPAQERSQVTVAAILQGASQVLVRFGYDRANTTLIAAAAGVSVGSLYQYFPNKEAVFSELLQQELTQVMDRMAESVAQVTGLAPQVQASIAAIIAYKASNPRLHRVLKTELGRIDGSRALRAMNQRALALTEALLRAHETELPLRDPARAAFFVVNTVEGVVGAALHEQPSMLTDPAFAGELGAAILGLLSTLSI